MTVDPFYRSATSTALALAAGLVLFSIPEGVNASPKLNVLLLTVDDMNCDSVGVYGCPISNVTPHIDRLASEGMRFEHAHVNIAICQPTRAVWMTGRYPHRNGALGFQPINPDVPTLLEALSEGGYFTGLLGKTSHVVPSRKDAWNAIVDARQLGAGRDPQGYAQHVGRLIEQSIAAQKPFFLMVNSHDPHRPFAGSAREKEHANVRRVFRPDEVPVPGFLPDLPQIREEVAQYFTSVHRADETVGAVLAALDASGLADDTLVMFLSDHGMAFPFAKTNCWRHSTRTPWIVRWPKVVSPGTVDDEHMIAGVDLAPTILDAVGFPSLDGVDGRTFVPLLRGEKQSNREAVFTSINSTAARRDYPMRAITTRRFGYVFNPWSDGSTVFHNESQSGLTMNAMREAAAQDQAIAARVHHFLYRTPDELYDYASDPHALHNLADDAAFKGTLDALRQQLLDHCKATGDPHWRELEHRIANH